MPERFGMSRPRSAVVVPRELIRRSEQQVRGNEFRVIAILPFAHTHSVGSLECAEGNGGASKLQICGILS